MAPQPALPHSAFHLVGVFDIGAHRDAVGKAGDLDVQRLEQAREIHGGGLTLHVGVGRHDDLLDLALVHTSEKLLDLELIGSDAIEGGQNAVENVVRSTVLLDLLHRHDGLGVRHDANDALVTGQIVAHGAHVTVGEVLADGAKMDLRLGIHDGPCKRLGVLGSHIQNRKRHAHGAFSPHAAELGKLLGKVLERFDVFSHRGIRTGRAYPVRP